MHDQSILCRNQLPRQIVWGDNVNGKISEQLQNKQCRDRVDALFGAVVRLPLHDHCVDREHYDMSVKDNRGE